MIRLIIFATEFTEDTENILTLKTLKIVYCISLGDRSLRDRLYNDSSRNHETQKYLDRINKILNWIPALPLR